MDGAASQSEGLPTGSPWSDTGVDGLDGQLRPPAEHVPAEALPECAYQCAMCQTSEVVVAS